MSFVLSGATIIDGVGQSPLEGHSILIEGARIKAIGTRDELGILPMAKPIDLHGKYIMPGLMNANVHLFAATQLERLTRHMGRFEDIIAESAQIALKNGLTTVFDTWGPRRSLMMTRDRINAGEIPGSRIFCAGNIIGFDGPLSHDFSSKGLEVASAALVKRINAIWVENVGRQLMWLPPDQVATEVRAYIGKGIDFVKYACNEHFGNSHGAFLAFSPRVQAIIVEEAHRAGMTAQAHTMSVEGLHIAIEAGCDLIQHVNHTGPVPIPEATLELLATRKTAAVVFPLMQRRLERLTRSESHRCPTEWQAADTNVRNLIRCGASLLLANDGLNQAPEAMAEPAMRRLMGVPGEDNLFDLATGHFAWFKAMEEKGCPPMEMLKAATRNIAVAYGRDQDLGTLEPGKIADLLVLDQNPLQAAENYRAIHMIVKDGVVVDRDALPVHPILTGPVEPPSEEELSYAPFLTGAGKFPMCPMCISR
jgi:imidazolonepropionase-like amidohydrolase